MAKKFNFCGNYSDGIFWDSQLTWNTTDPDFSECFHKTALVWIPCSILWLFLPVEIYGFRYVRGSRIPWTLLNVTKLVANGILFFLCLILLGKVVRNGDNNSNSILIDVGSPGIQGVSYILSFLLVAFERKKGVQSSPLFFFFWLASLICAGFTCHSLFRKDYQLLSSSQKFDFVVFQVSYLLVVVQFFLSCFTDARPASVLIEDVDEAACPRNTASFVSKLLFTWYDKLLWRGFRTKLTSKDVWRSPPEVLSKNSYHELLQHWTKRARRGERPSLTKVVADMHLSSYVFIWTMKFFQDIFIYSNPFILSWLISYASSDEPQWHGILYAFLMLFSTLFVSLLDWNADYYGSSIGYGFQSAAVSMIYRKSLCISNASKRTSTSGEAINFLSVDVEHITDFLSELIHILTLPLQVAVGIAMLYYFLGVAAFAGFVSMILLKFLSAYIANKLETIEGRYLKLKDERVKQINEAVLGIKILKFFAWELPFINLITGTRLKELSNLKKGLRYESVSVAIWSIAPSIVTLITLLTYILMDEKNVLDATKIFVTLDIVAILTIPLIRLPMFLVSFVQARVSVKRLNDYLNLKDLDTSYVTHDSKLDKVIAIEDGTFSWNPEGEEEQDGIILKNINLSVNEGTLVAIVGSVGCGKSSLLSGILGEMEKISGNVHTKGSVAYVPQQAWVQNATLKENVLFGRPANEGFYSKVITACGLGPDLAILPGGDATEIGENGINLSGGQKQRVSLARAAFSDADIYLLDDPLSAVDAHVGQHIFEHVIGHTGFLRKKTRVLVTHGITYLPYMDQIVVLSNGSISEVGTYEELMVREGDFAEFIATYGLTNHSTTSSKYKRSVSNRSRTESEGMEDVHGDEKAIGAKLTYAENAEHREATLSVYVLYLKYIGCPLTIAIFLLMVSSQVCSAGIQNWLSLWSVDTLLPDGSQDTDLRNLRMGVYCGLAVLFGLLVLTSFNVLMVGARKAAIGFHSKMLLSLFRSPMSFFDTTPSGRIINRFSEDIDVVDFSLPISFRDFMSCILEIITSIAVICIRVPLLIAVILPIGVGYGFLQSFFVKTISQLRRLESVSKSPLFSRFSETLIGCATIRAFSLQESFIQQFDDIIDGNVKMRFYRQILFWWIGLRLDMVGGVLVFFTALMSVMLKESLNPGVVGLIISYAITVNYTFAWLVYNAGELESNIVSVERIHEYILLPSEAEWEIPQNKPESDWPRSGQVVFENYGTRYRNELENILHHISVDVAACEKIGVVGRTGAGKSSITMSLFRIVEATEGTIAIDGVDISTIGLHELRSKLTIIPQDPVLFSGTLRLNLDPFEQYSDDELWRALEFSHLKKHVSSLSDGLMHLVAEGGSNLSVGQKQLVCLARALLRKTKILVLDEATAAVDLETDDLIQATIRKEFAECTVFTIAHRINTIMDSTRIILLDAGKVKEFDTPEHLLADSTSMFYGMAKDAGLI